MTINAVNVAGALAGIGHNGPPAAKYLPATADAETIVASLTKSMAAIESGARNVDNKGFPFLVSVADYLATAGGTWVQTADDWSKLAPVGADIPGKFPVYLPGPISGTTQERKEAVEKFLSEKGLKPGADNSAYTRKCVSDAVKLALMVTDDKYPISLGYKLSSPGRNERTGTANNPYQVNKPENGVKAERAIVAEHRVIVPTIRNGKDFVPNTGETLMSVTFAKGAEIYARLVKGSRGPKTKTVTAAAGDAKAGVAANGVAATCTALAELLTSKDYVTKAGDLVAPLGLARETVAKLNNRYHDDFPPEYLFALIALKNEIEERIQTMPDGSTYRTIPASGIGEGWLNKWDDLVGKVRDAA